MDIRMYVNPHEDPTFYPTAAASVPASVPTTPPSSIPSTPPSPHPSQVPTSFPTLFPTYDTPAPPRCPSATSVPGAPTAPPTSEPTYMTEHPSLTPSSLPTAVPTLSNPPTSVPTATPTSVPTALPSLVPSPSPTILPFGRHYCADFEAFGMEAYYKPVIALVTNATGVSSVECLMAGRDGLPGGDNDTAVLYAVAHFYATDEIDRSLGEGLQDVALKVNQRMKDNVIQTTKFNKKLKARIRNSFGGSRKRERRLEGPRLDRRTGRMLYVGDTMEYSYNATTAIQFVDSANITWVTTDVAGSIAPSGVPTSAPSPLPTTPPSPVPTSAPTSVPTTSPTSPPSPAPSAMPTPMCPTSYVDGNNMCDWWLWAWNYGPETALTDNPNGHDYSDDGSLDDKFYVINGQNCSRNAVDVINTDCKGLFYYCNETHCDTDTASGHESLAHDREASLCYEDYRGDSYRGFCSYVGRARARCACRRLQQRPQLPRGRLTFDLDTTNLRRRLGAAVDAAVSRALSTTVTAADLNDDVNFTNALKDVIADVCDFDDYGLTTSNIKDLVVTDNRRRLAVDGSGEQRALSTSSFAVDYTISYDPAVVDVDPTVLAAAVDTAATDALADGSFDTALTTYMPTEYASAVHGEVLGDPAMLLPLVLMWYGGAGLVGAVGVLLIKVVDSMDPPQQWHASTDAAKDAADDEALARADALEDHHGSEPASARAAGKREAAARPPAQRAAPAPAQALPAARVLRRPAGKHGLRKVRSANSLLVAASLSVPL
ncbi:putative 2OG-Fe(II) oxygenase [Aureococcus anophagefferens]|nr:putative 2OG-Fe(II) oxygenase [Aureococcus anophagefferens]